MSAQILRDLSKLINEVDNLKIEIVKLKVNQHNLIERLEKLEAKRPVGRPPKDRSND